jgi:hypothetical protein
MAVDLDKLYIHTALLKLWTKGEAIAHETPRLLVSARARSGIKSTALLSSSPDCTSRVTLGRIQRTAYLINSPVYAIKRIDLFTFKLQESPNVVIAFVAFNFSLSASRPRYCITHTHSDQGGG